MAESEAPRLLEWVADGADVGAFGYAEERSSYGREEVGVFVGIDMGDADSGALEFGDLGGGFAFDIFFADGAAKEGLDEIDEGWSEGFAVGA